MAIRHHPSDDLLLAYAAGSLSESLSLLVATHSALCPRCRREIERSEAIGAAVVEETEPVEMETAALASVLARLDAVSGGAEAAAEKCPAAPFADAGAKGIPEPLRSYLDGRLDDLRWRRLGPGVHQFPVLSQPGGLNTRLLRIAPQTTLPEHGHGGEEHTLVLKGCFFDGDEVFARGDLESAHGEIVHQPVSGPDEDCICLVVTDAPLRFTGLVGRILQPFVKF